MSIYKRIKADHDFHRELLDKLENTEGDSDTRDNIRFSAGPVNNSLPGYAAFPEATD